MVYFEFNNYSMDNGDSLHCLLLSFGVCSYDRLFLTNQIK